MRKDIATFFQTNQHNNQAPSPAKEPSVVPVLTITSQPQCHHQEDKLRARGIQRTFQLTLSTVFLAVNALRTVYIGETGRRLADNFREQRLDILHKKSDLTVAQHLNSPGHSLEDVHVAVLKSGLAKKDVRQRQETRQIFIFQTLAPRGINRDSHLYEVSTHARASFETRKQFQNRTRLQMTMR